MSVCLPEHRSVHTLLLLMSKMQWAVSCRACDHFLGVFSQLLLHCSRWNTAVLTVNLSDLTCKLFTPAVSLERSDPIFTTLPENAAMSQWQAWLPGLPPGKGRMPVQLWGSSRVCWIQRRCWRAVEMPALAHSAHLEHRAELLPE
jgi:hypothetical protein